MSESKEENTMDDLEIPDFNGVHHDEEKNDDRPAIEYYEAENDEPKPPTIDL